MEPELHEYLRVCDGCYKYKKSKQIQDVVDGKRDEVITVFLYGCIAVAERSLGKILKASVLSLRWCVHI